MYCTDILLGLLLSDISIDPVVKTIDIASASANANRQHLDKLMSEMDVGDQGGHGGALRFVVDISD